MRRVLSALLLVAAPAVAQRDLTPLDVVTLRTVVGVVPSPDGSRIVFARSEPRRPGDDPGAAYPTLWLLDADGERALVPGAAGVGTVGWRPDGSAVTFLERREGGAGRQLYALALPGGEPQRVPGAGGPPAGSAAAVDVDYEGWVR